MIYLDHNSTVPYSPSVRGYLEQGVLEDWYNPSSLCLKSQKLDQEIKECRKFIADYLNCPAQYLFFTSGGTESINTVLSMETLKLNHISSVITSRLEHHATLKKVEALSGFALNAPQKNNTLKYDSPYGMKSFFVSNNKEGEIDLNNLEELCSKHPRSLLSFLSANNETGVITDVKTISQIAKKYSCLIHVDAVQSLGKTPVDLESWDVDFASFSGHKTGAMKGIGLLYAKTPFAPLMYGGGQEKGYRSGTYNYPAIQSLKLAVQDIDLSKQTYIKNLRDYLENTLLTPMHKHLSKDLNPSHREGISFSTNNPEKKPSSFFRVNCRQAHRLSNTSSIYCGGNVSNQSVLFHLAKKGICVSAGSACNAGSPEPSHVIRALGVCEGASAKDYARSCIRVSLFSSNTKQEIDCFIKSLYEFYGISPHKTVEKILHSEPENSFTL